MKNLITLLSALLLSVALVNCGSDGGGGGAPAPGNNGIGDNVTQVNYTNRVTQVTYSENGGSSDFFITLSNGGFKCLAEAADDTQVSEDYASLISLLSSGSLGKGTQDTVGANPRYITLTYQNGDTRRINLNNDSASTEEDVLSNGQEISDFLDQLHSEINSGTNNNCNAGNDK
ncbi:MAG: hypothetical protein HRT44_12070 [Bdellovibrionales bacterium]|nr:hypothetical protein [Bdellovibrionales bacterium]NQZ19975.1 hypothetical protein [Bdellovibrionales bacterium]